MSYEPAYPERGGTDACVASNPHRRKCHNDETGYIAQRDHPLVPGTHVVLYQASKQGMDPREGGGRYLIVDEAHGGSLIQTANRDVAYDSMRHPDMFCDGCREMM